MRNIYYLNIFICFVLVLGISNNVHATSKITVTESYIKPNIPGSNITAAYMTINNAGSKAVRLEKISSTISDQIEIHQHSMINGMMSMRQVDSISIDAQSNVTLKPSGLHLMIFSLKQQITEKDVIPLTLYFSNETKINIQLPVYHFK